MHAIRIDSRPHPVRRLAILILSLLLLVTAMLIYLELRGPDEEQRFEIRLGYVLFVVGLTYSLLPVLWRSFRLRGTQTLVAVSASTIAVKPPRSHAIYIPWRECVDYYPAELTFVTRTGTSYSLGKTKLPDEAQAAAIKFIFERCWPYVEPDTSLGMITQEQIDQFQGIVGLKSFGRQRQTQWVSWMLLFIGTLVAIALRSEVIAILCMLIALGLSYLRWRTYRHAYKDLLSQAQGQCIPLADPPRRL